MKRSKSLLNLFQNSIYPNRTEITALKSDTKRIYNMAISNTVLKGYVDQMFKGGSYGRKTMIKDRYEGDFVLFLNQAVSNSVYGDLRDELEAQMKVLFPIDKKYQVNKNPVTIQLIYKNRELDVLIGFRSNSPDKVATLTQSNQKIYKAGSGPYQRKYLNDLVKIHPGIKDAIRLAKYWMKKYPVATLPTNEYPKSYAMELMVCYHIDNEYEGEEDLDDWFLDFLSWLNSTDLTKPMMFVQSTYSPPKSKPGIIIQDPGNPSENLANTWDSAKKFQDIAQRHSKNSINQIF